MRLVIASRKSDLARIQAYTVGQELLKKNPDLKIQYHFRESLGDKNINDPLWKMPEKGVFTEDFHQGLLSGEFDMVVHSWKDLPIQERQGTAIVATLPREDVRDLLLVKKSFKGGPGIRILTSSPRRAYNLQRHLGALLPWPNLDVQFEAVRGNIPTRIRKLLEGDAHGLVVAKAAIDRIMATAEEPDDTDADDEFFGVRQEIRQALAHLRWMVLPVQLNPPAAAQGALAVEIKQGRTDVHELLKTIHHPDTFACVQREREMLQSWGGGCHQKIGVSVLKKNYGTITVAQGVSDQGGAIDIFEFSPRPAPVIQDFSHFPDTPKQALWFERKPKAITAEWRSCNAHYVSKAEALPDGVQLDHEKDLIWASGIKTWQTLARRGLWVSGSSESLGEDENLLTSLIDMVQRRWCKWTHSQGEETPTMQVIKAYDLIPRSQGPLMNPQTQNFYWMSGSSFEQALSVYPWLIDKTHWCGPGHTYHRIGRILEEKKGKGAVEIALSFDQWQKIMKPS